MHVGAGLYVNFYPLLLIGCYRACAVRLYGMLGQFSVSKLTQEPHHVSLYVTAPSSCCRLRMHRSILQLVLRAAITTFACDVVKPFPVNNGVTNMPGKRKSTDVSREQSSKSRLVVTTSVYDVIADNKLHPVHGRVADLSQENEKDGKRR